MLNKTRIYKFVLDKTTLRPACPILQALYGGDREPCYLFLDWMIYSTPDFIGVKGTGAEIEDFASRVNRKDVT